MKVVISEEPLELGICVVDERENKDGKFCYSGLNSIIDNLIKNNNGKCIYTPMNVPVDIIDKHTFRFGKYVHDNGLFQANRHGSGYLFNCVIDPKYTAGTKTPFPGVTIVAQFPVDGKQEVQFQITNKIICNMIRIKLHIYEIN